MKTRHLLLPGVACALLAGCSADPAANEVAVNGGDATMTEGNGMAMNGHKGMNAQGPFASSEGAMHEKMMAAVGVDASDTWVRKMIEHHLGAIDMSREVLALDPTPDVRRMAQMVIDMQSEEIKQLRGMVREGTPDLDAGRLYTTADNQMMQEMMAASGANPSESWIRKMIAHHRGALAMSDVALGQNPPSEVRRLAEKTKVDQGKEIAELERMLQASGANG
jgi:uncharacterized protein (DUF305 family)